MLAKRTGWYRVEDVERERCSEGAGGMMRPDVDRRIEGIRVNVGVAIFAGDRLHSGVIDLPTRL